MRVVVLFLLAVVIVSATEAKEFKWQGVQVSTPISGELSIIEDKLSFRSSVSHFWIPSDDTRQFYCYLGPKIIKKWAEKDEDSFWLAPQIGVAGNRTEDGSDALIVSLWNRATFVETKVALFVEVEGYLNRSEQDYYGYYCFDYGLSSSVKIGAQVEQANKTVSFGPHIGLTRGLWRTELLYFACFQDDKYGHAVRITTGLSF